MAVPGAPRLLLYPQLAWMSLVVEHSWCDAEHRTSSGSQPLPAPLPRNRALAHLTAVAWLPCGDLHHYAHPSVRWNYLPALERHLTATHFTRDSLLLGPDSVTSRHFTASWQPPTRRPHGPHRPPGHPATKAAWP
ncbi:hypothetical protein [Streptomyces sp. NPDC057579]|uniref:hypothetical protein n=1 Tax=Streptomyces sp. NPDC057579 TaxID=3346172 RepID=UPI0036BD1870